MENRPLLTFSRAVVDALPRMQRVGPMLWGRGRGDPVYRGGADHAGAGMHGGRSSRGAEYVFTPRGVRGPPRGVPRGGINVNMVLASLIAVAAFFTYCPTARAEKFYMVGSSPPAPGDTYLLHIVQMQPGLGGNAVAVVGGFFS